MNLELRKTNLLFLLIFKIIKILIKRIFFNFIYYFNYKLRLIKKRKASNEPVFFIKNNKNFILDIRDLHADLHQLTAIFQFLPFLKKRYDCIEIYTNKFTTVYESYYGYKIANYTTEYKEIFSLVSKSLKINFVSTNNLKLNKNFDYISFYRLTNSGYLNQPKIRQFFINKLNFKSEPFTFFLNLDYKSKNITHLSNYLKKTYNIIFSPTYDLKSKIDKKSKYGVISKNTFQMLDELYKNLLCEIEKRKIKDIRILLLNKKALDWQYNDYIVDLRNFENYNMNFGEILFFLQEHAQWSISSEGTFNCLLMMSKNLKHCIFVDDTFFEDSDGSTVPFHIKNSFNKIYSKDDKFIPNQKIFIDMFFKDYNNFKLKN